MSDDLYYYRERCSELESEIGLLKKTLAKYGDDMYSIRKLAAQKESNPSVILSAIYWIACDWKS